MIGAIVAWALAALEDADTGLNATRVGIPRRPLTDPPPACALYSQNESAWVARAEIPSELLTRNAIVLLRQASEFEAPFLPEDPSPATVDLAILAVARGDQTHVQLVQLEQLLRTALRVIALATPQGADPTITVDGVDFSPAGRVTWLPPVTTPDTPLMLGVVLSFAVTDAWSLGT
jgi:hypothetical protein